MTVVCAAGKWEKIGGGEVGSAAGDVEADRLIIETGTFDFVGGVNLNAVKDNATNASDVGDIVLAAAPSFEGTSADGGSLMLHGGAAYQGDGGDVAVQAGAAADGAGGAVNVRAGSTTGAGGAGALKLSSGSAATSDAGDVELAAGSAATSGDGGDVTIAAGSSDSGAGGSVLLSAGGSTSGAPGSVEIAAGASELVVSTDAITLTGPVVHTATRDGSVRHLCIDGDNKIGFCTGADGACGTCTPL